MARSELITRSLREADRIKTIEAIASKDLRPGVAAARLKLRPSISSGCQAVRRASGHRLQADESKQVCGLAREDHSQTN